MDQSGLPWDGFNTTSVWRKTTNFHKTYTGESSVYQCLTEEFLLRGAALVMAARRGNCGIIIFMSHFVLLDRLHERDVAIAATLRSGGKKWLHDGATWVF